MTRRTTTVVVLQLLRLVAVVMIIKSSLSLLLFVESSSSISSSSSSSSVLLFDIPRTITNLYHTFDIQYNNNNNNNNGNSLNQSKQLRNRSSTSSLSTLSSFVPYNDSNDREDNNNTTNEDDDNDNEPTIVVQQHHYQRWLQGGGPKISAIPQYTSPPLDVAIQATPEAYRSDDIINEYRNASFYGNCTASNTYCQIVFEPDYTNFNTTTTTTTTTTSEQQSPVGVILYHGGLVDPRSYSVVASLIIQRYGLPVVIPVFPNDLPFSFTSCSTGRITYAQYQFPYVQQWILVGHSFGGTAAVADLWSLYNDPTLSSDSNTTTTTSSTKKTNTTSTTSIDTIGGLVLLASDVQPILPNCAGSIDFSNSTIPMALAIGSNDGLINRTRYDENRNRTSSQFNYTWYMNILGGTHGGFAAYNTTNRATVLNQSNDGIQDIPYELQWDISLLAIYHVAYRTGLSLPQLLVVVMDNNNNTNGTTNCPTSSGAATATATIQTFIITLSPGKYYYYFLPVYQTFLVGFILVPISMLLIVI